MDAQLMSQIAHGDREALGTLYDLYSTPLYSFAIEALNDHRDAEDVLMEVFVDIWEKAPSFDQHTGTPFNWALSMTRTKSIHRLRACGRPRPGSQEQIRGNCNPHPRSEANRPNDSPQFRKALNELPRDQRHPIELAFFGGLTAVEIAEALQEFLPAITKRIRCGMFRLGKSFESPSGRVLTENVFASSHANRSNQQNHDYRIEEE